MNYKILYIYFTKVMVFIIRIYLCEFYIIISRENNSIYVFYHIFSVQIYNKKISVMTFQRFLLDNL